MEVENELLFGKTIAGPENPSHLKRRLVTACRNQMTMQVACLDDLIDKDHPARRIWEYLEQVNLSIPLENVKSVEGASGRPAIDPKILMALWLYATVLGIGSAWALSDYCKDHIGFKWLCGGVSIDRKTLSNFRSSSGKAFDELLIKGIAILNHANLVTLQEIAQDGLRVRASAGKHSFHREKTLKAHLEEAKGRVEFLKQEIENDPASCRNRIKTTQLIAAKERLERLARANEELKQYCETKDQKRIKHKKKALTESEKAEMRVSSTDPDARRMKMADGGFRPAYNVQFAVDTGSQAIVGVDVSKNGNDGEEMLLMYQRIKETYKTVPLRYLVDGGFLNKTAMQSMYEEGCKVFVPAEKSEQAKKNRVRSSWKDEFILDWLTRMKTEEGRTIYRRRASSVECVNAQARSRGLYQFVVRGLDKAKIIAKLMAVAHNMVRTMAFGLV